MKAKITKRFQGDIIKVKETLKMTLCTFCHAFIGIVARVVFYACRGQRPEFLSVNGSATKATEKLKY